MGTTIGRKSDQDKLRYDLVDPEVHADMVAALTFGAKKYAPGNWRKVPNAKTRYYAALLRHLEAMRLGETHDPESGLTHASHAMCCLHFMSWFYLHPDKEVINDTV